ncbi:hypothetical protein OUZ56_025524 [Daphnia magna]|uniref:Uncharacterized protein n=1 Tax=Daphnia magna TaxID=35525 RepID=A0ABQ9ZK40_9CRUS|nr:hypothetical protein OUZ56_025524 [Daphnia magna]
MIGSKANPRTATTSQAPPDIGQADVVSPMTYDPFVTQRICKAIRSQITRTCRKITNIIQAEGSRGAIKSLVNHAKSLLDTACKLQHKLIDVVDDATVDKQHDIHLNYVQQIGLVESDCKKNLERRKVDPATEAISFHGFSTAHGSQRPPLPTRIPQRSQAASYHSIASVPSRYVPAPTRSCPNPSQEESSSSDEADAAREALQQLELARRNTTTPDNERGESRVRRWVKGQQLCRQKDSTPDVWIDLYWDGRLHTTRREFSDASSSIRAELGDFNEKALEWFSWIDLFCALENYGRRDVMRAALMQALEKLSIYKQDPSSFRRFSEKTRTFLYDLSRIGESVTVDVIERLCLKLPFADRLAWNTDQEGDLERRSLNEFGNWLCQRAMAYQNAYTIAEEQSQESQPRPKERFATRSHAANADSSRCFNCFGTYHTSRESVGMVQAQVYDVDWNIVLANVFLGEGSDSTLFREGFIPKLRLDGTPHTFSVDRAGGVRSKYGSRRVQISGMSESEKQAVQILEAGTRRLDVGYEVPITWKTGEPNLSNNQSLAGKRKKSLLRLFYEDPIFEEDYRQAMEKILKMGYVVYVEDPSDSQPEYYLAHH